MSALNNSLPATVTDSRRVAQAVGKKHKNILRAIRDLLIFADFRSLHYQPETYIDNRGKEQPLVNMTAQGEQTLVHSFTARRADLTKTSTYALLAQGLNRIKIVQTTHLIRQRARLQEGCPVPLVLLASLAGSQKAKIRQQFSHLAAGEGDWYLYSPELQTYLTTHSVG